MKRLIVALLMMACPVGADGTAGDFDYYVLSLSWSPNWCASEGDARQSPQCDGQTAFGWVLHGLWPQYERGYPINCRSTHAPPSRTQTGDMADVMGTSGLAWHQWNKHGVCSGLSPADYYAASRRAYENIQRPNIFRQLDRTISLPASVVEAAFLRDNPGISADGLTITCKQGYIQEARICLTRDLQFRACGTDVVRDCTLDDALFDPIR